MAVEIGPNLLDEVFKAKRNKHAEDHDGELHQSAAPYRQEAFPLRTRVRLRN